MRCRFRGTSSTKNWDPDFRVTLIHPDNTDQQLRVHEGFYRAFVKPNEGKLGIEDKMGAIKQATNGAVPIYITGHSLGGALAQIAAAVLGSDQVGACYTYGSPRVGNSYFDLWVKVPSYRVLNYADIVPQVPLPICISPFCRSSLHARSCHAVTLSFRAESFGARLANDSRVNSAH